MRVWMWVGLGLLVAGLEAGGDWACAQEELGPVRGLSQFDHVGKSVLASGRFLTVATDSLAMAAVGSGELWLVAPGGRVMRIPPPVGASTVYGAGGAKVSGYASAGFDAVAVGDPGFDSGRGRVSIYLGSSSFASSPAITVEGLVRGDLFGDVVAYIGDVNEDGFGDFAVGAPGAASGAGRAFIFLGGPTPSTMPALALSGAVSGDLFGSSIVAAGDVDEDGHSDYAIGSPGASGGQGEVAIFRGGTVLSATPLETVSWPGGTPPYGQRLRFGAALAGGLDLTGDGRPDLVVGAPGASGESGSAFVFRDSSGAFGPSFTRIDGTVPFDHFGATATMDGFVGDGTVGLAIGAPGASEGRGGVRIFRGAASLASQPDALLSGGSPDDAFGFSLGSGKLFPQSIAPQVLIGAPLADVRATNGGVAYFYTLSPLVAVEDSPLLIEADGVALKANDYTSTAPLLTIRMPGISAADTASVELTVDGVKLTGLTVKSGHGTKADGVDVQLSGLSEGHHDLGARLQDRAHTRAGFTTVAFNAAARLRIDSARVLPNPAVGAARLSFTLTRPASYDLQLFDVAGRRVSGVGPKAGTPDENSVALSGPGVERRLASGVYFYVLRASYAAQTAVTKGRFVLLR